MAELDRDIEKLLADIEAEVTYVILVEMMKEAWEELRKEDQPKALKELRLLLTHRSECSVSPLILNARHSTFSETEGKSLNDRRSPNHNKPNTTAIAQLSL